MSNTPEQFEATVTANPDQEYTTIELRGKHVLQSDEPKWLPKYSAGNDDHPSPVDYFMTSLASCQVSVLEQCLERNGVEAYDIECEAVLDKWGRADDKPDEMPDHTANRIEHITVKMTLYTTAEYRKTAERCLTVYDDGCVVGQSLAGGIDYSPLAALEIVETLP